MTMREHAPAWTRLRRHRVSIVSLGVLAIVLVACAAAPLLTPYGASEQDVTGTFRSPDGTHWLGTDSLGRDQFARLLYGGRVSLAVGFGVAVLSGAFGTLIGMLAGYAGGVLDTALMRFTDFVLGLPGLIFLIVAARAFGDSILVVVVIVAALS
jgi:ABC-type dipeptide/oligopeptide/nickel transport system permease subunit